MIVLKNFRLDVLKNEYRKGIPFRWNYVDTETNETISRKEAKRRHKNGKQVIGLYNPMKLVQEMIAAQQESDSESPQDQVSES